MFKRVPLLLVGLIVGLPLAFGQPSQAPEWKHGLELRVRKAGEADFTKDTKRFGTEVFLDKNTNQWVAISETGWLGAPRAPKAGAKEAQAPRWLHALELKCRKAGEADFTKDTKRWSIEVFRDDATNQVVYICENGALALVPAGSAAPPKDQPKAPTWLHGLEVKCRKGGEVDFTKETKRIGIEVFRDENTGNIIYITDTGAIAAIPGGGISPASPIKGPLWLHGLEFRVRRADEPNFTKETRNFGAEIFRDENTNQLFYITETGAIAVVPATGVSRSTDTKPPKWLHGLELKCRKAGESDFSKETKRWGIEVFQDPNTGLIVYIAETGSLAVPVK
jgi:hypothetical protein